MLKKIREKINLVFNKSYLQLVFLFLFFLVMAVILTRMPVQDIGSVLPGGGDPYLVSYIWSWEMYQIPIDPLNLFNTNIFAPYQNTLAFTEHMLGSLILAWPIFLIFKNIVLTFNLVSLLTFAISGIGMYLLAYYFTKNKWASLIAGFIYAFAPYKIHHLQHINLSGMWLPYVFLYLEKFFDRQSWKNILVLTLFVILVFLNAMQYFLFLMIVILFFLLRAVLSKKFFLRGNIGKIGLCLLILLIIVLPLMMPYLQLKKDFDFQREIWTIEGLSPDLFDYFVSPFAYKYFYPAFFPEWVIGPGVFVILLLITSSWFIYRGLDNIEVKNRAVIYYLIGLMAVLFSFGYFIQFTRADQFGVIGPWAFFYNYIPGFDGIRAVGRFSIFFLLGVSVIIAIGLSEVYKRIKLGSGRRIILALVVIFLLMLEFGWAFSGSYILAERDVPEIYKWVKEQDKEKIYIELPFGENHLRYHYDAVYEYYSIYHFRKIINGYSGYAPESYKELNKNLIHFDENDIDLIKNYGATHIIFHSDYFSGSSGGKILEKLEKSDKVKLIKRVDNDFVYEIFKD